MAQKLLSYSDTHKKMIEDLKERTGISNANTILINALVDYHKKFFPAYAPNTPSGPKTDEDIIKEAQDKFKAKKAIKEAEENAKIQPKIDICVNVLKGQIETNEGGFKFCRFQSFGISEERDMSQLLPIKQVDPILEETMLFNPTKEVVFKHRPEIKKLFK